MHWLGDPNADIVILYCHGGGYTQPATSGTFLYLQHIIDITLSSSTPENPKKKKEKETEGKRKTVAGLVLAYSLSIDDAYPTQLKQAVATLSHLLKTHHPCNIMISGDSAGGDLVLGLLSHILHPHPQIPGVEMVAGGRFAGVVLYSPMTTFQENWESVRRNGDAGAGGGVDMIPVRRIRWWGAVLHDMHTLEDNGEEKEVKEFLQGDAYTEPCLNKETWWVGLDKIVEGLLVTCGSDEVYLDSILETVGKVRKGWVGGGGDEDGVMVVETKGEAHIGPIVEFMMSGGKVGGCVSQRVVEEWYLARVMC